MPEPVIHPTAIGGLLAVVPTPIHDERGFFVRTMNADVLAAADIDVGAFVEENQSRSRRGTLRGFHFRTDLEERKLLRCARGAMFTVVVDLRPSSASFLRWEPFTLDDIDHRQLLVPPGCANGYEALTDEIDVCYKHTVRYDQSRDGALVWDDPELAIPWPYAPTTLSARDRDAPLLRDLRPRLEGWFGS